MPDPFNITQVDIPGIYGAVRQNQMGRIQQMLGERQIRAADLQANRDNAIQGILARAYSAPAPVAASASTGGTAAATPTPAQTPAPPTAGAMPAVTPQGLPGADPAGTAAPMRIPPQLAQQLLAQGPDGVAMLHTINTASDEQLTSMQHRLQALAPLYANASHIPYGTDGSARRAYIRSVLPEIQQMGIDPQQATSWDPTDQNLNAHMSFGQTTNDALESARGHPMALTQGGSIVDTDNIDPRTGQAHVLAESPVVSGPGGEPFARSQNMSQLPHQAPPQPGEVRQTTRGPMRFRGGDYRNPANYDPVQGGAAQPNAPDTFRQDGGAFDFNANPPGR